MAWQVVTVLKFWKKHAKLNNLNDYWFIHIFAFFILGGIMSLPYMS